MSLNDAALILKWREVKMSSEKQIPNGGLALSEQR
jgi:hypothetical protein